MLIAAAVRGDVSRTQACDPPGTRPKFLSPGSPTVSQNRTIMNEGRGSGDAGGPGDSARVCRSGGLRYGGYRHGPREDLLRGRCARLGDMVDDDAAGHDEDGDDCARQG